MFTDVNHLAILGLVLLVGLVLGLLLGSGGKWKGRYLAEREAHAATKADADARWKEREALTSNRDAYVRDLEAENARLKAERP